MIGTCKVEGCDRLTKAHCEGMCEVHYSRWRLTGRTEALAQWVNPLVCVCPEPDADPSRDFGMCQVCKRKPLALMKARAA